MIESAVSLAKSSVRVVACRPGIPPTPVPSPASGRTAAGSTRDAERAKRIACNDAQVNAQTESGTQFKAVYGPEDLAEFDPDLALGEPGHYPYARDINPSMYSN